MAAVVGRARLLVRDRVRSSAWQFRGSDRGARVCATARDGPGRARAANGARVGVYERECPVCRCGDGERDAHGGTGQTLIPFTALGTANGTIVSETTNVCGVVG
jgi:hypothetical protein